MGWVKDVRKLFQDVVAPELKALGVKIDHLAGDQRLMRADVQAGFARLDRQALTEERWAKLENRPPSAH